MNRGGINHLFSFAAGTAFGMACILLGDSTLKESPQDSSQAVIEPTTLAPIPSPVAIDAAMLEAAPTPPVQDLTAAEAPTAPDPLLPQGELRIPVYGISPQQLHDTFSDSRSGGHVHDAIDIMAPEGTPVHAVADGAVAKLFTSVPGGLTVYQFDEHERFSYYYAHLSRYAEGLEAGQQLRAGDVIGYVGHSGNASAAAPHLHFAVARLGPEKRWWQGTALNPYPLLTGRAD